MSDWQFELEDLEEDEAEAEAEAYGLAATPVEPGSPNAENVAFVLLGVAAAVFVIAQVLL